MIGQVVDTNSAWIGQKLSEIGIKVRKIVSLPDDHEEIISGLKMAMHESDYIFITGGLGPTKDDITKKAIADFLGVDMYFDDVVFDKIQKIFARSGKPLSPSHHDQCYMPVGAQILNNSMGTAPGMRFVHQGKHIISMPGVPYEMKAIMNEVALPMLISESTSVIIHKTILTCCVGETAIENNIAGIVSTFPENLKIAYLPSVAQVRLRLSASGSDRKILENMVHHFTTQITDILGNVVYGYDTSSLEMELLRICVERKITIGTAESCTGGNIASRIVSVSGSSAYFNGGITAYSNDVKMNLLHVNHLTLERFGAVSEETVKEMVEGALDVLKADVAVAVSGIAGPDGGSAEKPVGTIWICVGDHSNKKTFLLKAGKDRSKNIETATVFALNMLRKFVTSLPV